MTSGATVSLGLYNSQSNPLLPYRYFTMAEQNPALMGGFNLAFAQELGARGDQPVASLAAQFPFLDREPVLAELESARRAATRLQNGLYRLTVNMGRAIRGLERQIHEQNGLLLSIQQDITRHQEAVAAHEAAIADLRTVDLAIHTGIEFVGALSRVGGSPTLVRMAQVLSTAYQMNQQIGNLVSILSSTAGVALGAAQIAAMTTPVLNVGILCLNLLGSLVGGSDQSQVLAAIDSVRLDLQYFRQDFAQFQVTTGDQFYRLGSGIQILYQELSRAFEAFDRIRTDVNQVRVSIDGLNLHLQTIIHFLESRELQRQHIAENAVYDSCGFGSDAINLAACLRSVQRYYNDELRDPARINRAAEFQPNRTWGILPLYEVANNLFTPVAMFPRFRTNPYLWLQGATHTIRLFESGESSAMPAVFGRQWSDSFPELCRLNEDYLAFARQSGSFLESLRRPFVALDQNGGIPEADSLSAAFGALTEQYREAAQEVDAGLIYLQSHVLRGEVRRESDLPYYVDPYHAPDGALPAGVMAEFARSLSSASACAGHTDLGLIPIPDWLRTSFTTPEIYTHLAQLRLGQPGISLCYRVDLLEGTSTEMECVARGTRHDHPDRLEGGRLGLRVKQSKSIEYRTGFFNRQSRLLNLSWQATLGGQVIRQTQATVSEFPVRMWLSVSRESGDYALCRNPRIPGSIFDQAEIQDRSWPAFNQWCAATAALFGGTTCANNAYQTHSEGQVFPADYTIPDSFRSTMMRHLLIQDLSYFSRSDAQRQSFGFATAGNRINEAVFTALLTTVRRQLQVTVSERFVEMIGEATNLNASAGNDSVIAFRSSLNRLNRARLALEGYFRIYLPTTFLGRPGLMAAFAVNQTTGDQTRLAVIDAFRRDNQPANPNQDIRITLPGPVPVLLQYDAVAETGSSARRIQRASGDQRVPIFSDNTLEYDYYDRCLPDQLRRAVNEQGDAVFVPHHLPASTDVVCSILSYFMAQPVRTVPRGIQGEVFSRAPRSFADVSRSVGQLFAVQGSGNCSHRLPHRVSDECVFDEAIRGAAGQVRGEYLGYASRFEYEQQVFRVALQKLARNHTACEARGIAPVPYSNIQK